MTQRTMAFELTMPNNNAWNGKWTGEDSRYLVFRRFKKSRADELDDTNHYYKFGDGWGANVRCFILDSASQSRKLRRISAGFCGYEWMVDEILLHGRILTLSER